MFDDSVILSVAKDLRRYVGLNCGNAVFNQNIGKNQESASSEIDPRRSFASLRMTAVMKVKTKMTELCRQKNEDDRVITVKKNMTEL